MYVYTKYRIEILTHILSYIVIQFVFNACHTALKFSLTSWMHVLFQWTWNEPMDTEVIQTKSMANVFSHPCLKGHRKIRNTSPVRHTFTSCQASFRHVCLFKKVRVSDLRESFLYHNLCKHEIRSHRWISRKWDLNYLINGLNVFCLI